MSKGIVAGAAVLGLVGAGVGGYFAIDYRVRTTIDEQFSTTSQNHPLISSASYDSIDVDLLKDRVTLNNVQLGMDLSALDAHYSARQPSMHIKGNMQQSFETVSILGAWDILFGATKVKHTELKGGAFSGTVIQTKTTPAADPTQSRELTQKNTKPQGPQVTTTFDGTLGSTQIDGFDLSSVENVQALSAQPFTMDGYKAQDLKVAIAIKPFPQKAESLPAKQAQIIHVDISTARILGKQISPTYFGLIRYENTVFDIENPKPDGAPIHMTVGEISLTDTEVVDMIAVRSTSELKDFVVDTSNIDDPKGKAFMAMLGIDRINLNMKLHYDFDRTKHTISVTPFRLGLKQAGSMDVSFALNGLPEQNVLIQLEGLQGKPKKINAALENALKDVALNQISIGYRDEGVLKKILATQALQMKAEPAQLAQAYAQQGAMIISAVFGEEQALKAQKNLTAFLTEPDALRIKLTAKTPVNLKALEKDIKANGLMALKAFELDVQGGADAIAN